MTKIRTFAVLAVTVLLGHQLVACSSQVSANESARLAALWNGFHAEVRLVVYYNTDLSLASDEIKSIVKGLSPDNGNLHCNEATPIYVLEITEAGNKRKFSSDNNHCRQDAGYAGYVPAQAMAQLAQALSATQTY
jgi:hypothetical protein